MKKLKLSSNLILIAFCLAQCFSLKATPIHKLSIEEISKKITPMLGKTPVQWRVTWTGDASTEATISWSTAEESKRNTVHYGTSDQDLNVRFYRYHLNSKNSGQYTKDKDESEIKSAYYHHVVLKNLRPNTKYYFVLDSDGELSKRLYFKTAPKSGLDFSLLVGGDSRSGHLARCRMNLFMADQFKKSPHILGLIHGGDYIATGRKWQQWRLWLSHNELTTLKDGRVLPIIPARGNHDGGILYNEVFNIPTEAIEKKIRAGSKSKRVLQPLDCHLVRLGRDASIITLNTNRSAAEQVEWLEAQLKSLRLKTKWLLTQYHRPFFPAVKTPSACAKTFVPLFEKYSVDLACESDGHCIKRTVPIRNEQADPTGVTYIGEGGLGVGQYKPDPERWYLVKDSVGRGHHNMLLDFKNDSLKISVHKLGEELFDEHTLKIRSRQEILRNNKLSQNN